VLEAEGILTVDLATTRAQAKGVALAINREGGQRPVFARDSQNVAALLDTLLAPSTNRVDKFYHQLKGILGVTAAQQAESSLQRWAKISISSLDRSKASRQRTTTELPMVRTASLPAQVLTRIQQGNPCRRPEPPVCLQAHKWDEGARSEHSARNLRHSGRNDREGHSLSPEGLWPNVTP
jgi:hypothetical protein